MNNRGRFGGPYIVKLIETEMVVAALALPEVDDSRLDNEFYLSVNMSSTHHDFLRKAENRIKDILLMSYSATVAELERVEEHVPAKLFKGWCLARFSWSPETVRQIREAVPQAKAHLDAVRNQRDLLILEMRNKCMTQKKIAEEIGITRERVGQVERGSEKEAASLSGPASKGRPKGSGSKLTPTQKREIVEALAKGETTRDLATRFKCAPSTIKRVKQRVGLAPPALPEKPTEGSTVAHSQSNHSPSLRRLRTSGTPEALAMEDHKNQFFKAIMLLLQDISKAEKRLNTLQNEIQEDFTRYHGAMLARWAAYESVWAADLFDACGCETFDEVKQILTGRIRKLETKAKQSLATLDRIKSTIITIEE
jgi:transposase